MTSQAHHEVPTPMSTPFFTKGTIIVSIIAGLGILGYLYRLVFGLEAATNLDDQWPWGIWIAVDVAVGCRARRRRFHHRCAGRHLPQERYHVITRPALLTAMLGYTFVVIGLAGRSGSLLQRLAPDASQHVAGQFGAVRSRHVRDGLPDRALHRVPADRGRTIQRARRTGPGSAAHFNRYRPSLCCGLAETFLSRFIFIFIIAGVVLSCLHQSSLGTLMVIAPTKMHPLWYTPMSPLLFLLSAIAVGFPMVIFESILASRSFKLKPETKVLSSLASYTPILLGAYLVAKLVDITIRNAWPYVFEGSFQSMMWIIEMLFGVVLPLVMLSIPKVRKSIKGLFISATLVIIMGVALNRINVFLVAYRPLYSEKTYFPSIFEITVTLGLVAVLVLVYRFFVKTFPVISVQEERIEAAPAGYGRAAAYTEGQVT